MNCPGDPGKTKSGRLSTLSQRYISKAVAMRRRCSGAVGAPVVVSLHKSLAWRGSYLTPVPASCCPTSTSMPSQFPFAIFGSGESEPAFKRWTIVVPTRSRNKDTEDLWYVCHNHTLSPRILGPRYFLARQRARENDGALGGSAACGNMTLCLCIDSSANAPVL